MQWPAPLGKCFQIHIKSPPANRVPMWRCLLANSSLHGAEHRCFPWCGQQAGPDLQPGLCGTPLGLALPRGPESVSRGKAEVDSYLG